MQIQSIGSTNFESRTKFMTPKMKQDVHSILYRMNLDTIRTKRGDCVESSIVTKLIDNKKNAVFEDDRHFKEVHPFSKQMKGFSTLKMGKSFVEFDNEAGEISDYSKPFFKPWFIFKKEIEKYLDNFRTNISGVKTEVLNMRNLTPEGHKKKKICIRI